MNFVNCKCKRNKILDPKFETDGNELNLLDNSNQGQPSDKDDEKCKREKATIDECENDLLSKVPRETVANPSSPKKHYKSTESCCLCKPTEHEATSFCGGSEINSERKKKQKAKKTASVLDNDACSTCGVDAKKKRKQKKHKKDKGMCGGKKNKRKCACECAGEEPNASSTLVQARNHDGKCQLEFAVLQKHAKGCSARKARPKKKEDRSGSYDVIGRVVYPGCIVQCTGRNVIRAEEEQPDPMVEKEYCKRCCQNKEESSLQWQVAAPLTAGYKCLECGMEGPLCTNPNCEWSKLVHKAKCSNVASPKEKKVCEKCADKLMKNREICNDSDRHSNVTAAYLSEMRDDGVEADWKRKEMKIEKLQKIIQDAEPAVMASKSNKSFPTVNYSKEFIN